MKFKSMFQRSGSVDKTKAYNESQISDKPEKTRKSEEQYKSESLDKNKSNRSALEEESTSPKDSISGAIEIIKKRINFKFGEKLEDTLNKQKDTSESTQLREKFQNLQDQITSQVTSTKEILDGIQNNANTQPNKYFEQTGTQISGDFKQIEDSIQEHTNKFSNWLGNLEGRGSIWDATHPCVLAGGFLPDEDEHSRLSHDLLEEK